MKAQKLLYFQDQTNRVPAFQNVILNDIYSMERGLEKSDTETWLNYSSRFKIIHQRLAQFYNSDHMKERRNFLKMALLGEKSNALNGPLQKIPSLFHMIRIIELC
jgi:response regulator RpfG family c-di-GMP phosphodiesterase